MRSIKHLWERIITIGVTPDLEEQDAKYVRLTNGIAVLTGLWLFSLILPGIPFYPSSKYLMFNSVFFPLLWLLVPYFNHKKLYRLAKLFYSYSAMVCITLNALQIGRETDNHLFLLAISIFAFYSWPPKQLKYIILISVSALLAFVAVELYSSSHGALLEASASFFQVSRLVSLIALYLLVFMLTLYNYNTLHQAQELLEIEHKKSEKLLLNILPPVIANRLKANHTVIADRVNEATILFADVAGFTVLSQAMEPERLVEILNDLFSEFDRIVKAYDLEKIKTIGDAYMVAGGIPEARGDHCEAVALCALEMQSVMQQGISEELQKFQLRIGIHTGPVVAGVIGKSKFIYDLWGDSVNTASRMESHGVENKIQVTKDVYLKLKERFDFEDRREIEVKGKGVMETYFLVGKRAQGVAVAES